MKINVNYKGLQIEVKGDYYPEEPASKHCPPSSEYFEFESIKLGEHDLLDLLSEDDDFFNAVLEVVHG